MESFRKEGQEGGSRKELIRAVTSSLKSSVLAAVATISAALEMVMRAAVMAMMVNGFGGALLQVVAVEHYSSLAKAKVRDWQRSESMA